MARKRDLPKPTQEALTVITRGVKKGLTQAQIQSNIRDKLGKGIRDDFLRQGVRFAKGEDDINPPANPKFINRQKAPDIARIKPSRGTLTRRFSYRFSITTMDDEGKETIGGLTVTSSTRLSKSQAIQEAFRSVAASGLQEYLIDELPDEFDIELTEILTSSDFLLDT